MHDAEEIAAPDFLDVGLAVTAGEQLAGEVDELGRAGQTGDTTVAVEVGAETDMIDADHLDGVLEMGHDIEDGGLTVAAQETMVDGGLSHTAFGGEGAELIVGEVAGMVAEGPATAMAAHDGLGADVEGIVKTLLTGMAHVDEDAQTVHLADDLLAEGADTAMGVVAARGGVADVVVAIMAEGDINHATILEMLQALQMAVEGEAVLDAEHDALQTTVLVEPEVVGGAGQGDIGTVLGDNLFDLVEDAVGKGRGPFDGLGVRGEGLGQVGHHDGGVLTALGHLMEIDEDLGVALVEVDAFGEKHGGVAVGVEGEHTVVDTVGLPIAGGLAYEPLEQGLTIGQALGVPLDTDDRLILAALHGLDDAVGRGGHGAELIAGVIDCLVVERVDLYLCCLIGNGDKGIFLYCDTMGGLFAGGILRMLDTHLLFPTAHL